MKNYDLRDFLGQAAALPQGETTPELETAREQVNEDAEENFHDPRWQREQAALISEAIDTQTRRPGFAPGVLRFRALGREDKIQRRFTKGGIRIFTTAAGGYVEESSVTNDFVEAGRSVMAWHVVGTPEEAMADWALSMSSLVAAANLAEENEILRRQFALLEEATAVGGPQHVDATGSGLTPAVLKAALLQVADYARPETRRGLLPTQVTVIGRQAAVSEICDFPGYSEAQLNEINQTGTLGRYRGATIQGLVNVIDTDDEEIFDPNDVWVVSSDCGEYATFGAPRINSWVENNYDKFHTKSRRDAGGVVWATGGMVRITIA